MVFMGSKARYADSIVPILQKTIDDNNITKYIECFVGGANVIDKIRCEERYGFDNSDTLIALLQQAQEDFSKIPEDGTREMWDEGKAYIKDGIQPTTLSLADIGAIQYFGSYNNGGFPRGYAKPTSTRNYYKEAYRNMKAQAPNLQGIVFKCQNYWELTGAVNCLIYLDPPYQNTKQYNYASQPSMDYTRFWNWVRKISKNNYVYISEQSAPEDFEVIWEQNVTRTTNLTNDFKATEKLFKFKNT